MTEQCSIPPSGWHCTRTAGHDGPCAAVQDDQIAKLKSMSRKATPGMWEVDDEYDVDAKYHDFLIGADDKGKWGTILSTRDSTMKEIEEDYDEDYHRAWDSVGDANAKFAVACVNYVRSQIGEEAA